MQSNRQGVSRDDRLLSSSSATGLRPDQNGDGETGEYVGMSAHNLLVIKHENPLLSIETRTIEHHQVNVMRTAQPSPPLGPALRCTPSANDMKSRPKFMSSLVEERGEYEAESNNTGQSGPILLASMPARLRRCEIHDRFVDGTELSVHASNI